MKRNLFLAPGLLLIGYILASDALSGRTGNSINPSASLAAPAMHQPDRDSLASLTNDVATSVALGN